jgi:hypothetical protein
MKFRSIQVKLVFKDFNPHSNAEIQFWSAYDK